MDPLAIERAARFVSLIPFLDDSHGFDEMPECWCTDEQFLTLNFGDFEEHSILLCNYFNYIDKAQNRDITSYIVLGRGNPEGVTAYVLRKANKTNDIELWNACTGRPFYMDQNVQDNRFLCCLISRTFSSLKTQNDAVCQLKELNAVVTR